MKVTPILLIASLTLYAPLTACERNPQSDTSTTNSSAAGGNRTGSGASSGTSTTNPSTTRPAQNQDATRAPDNTGNNRVDRSGDTVTPPDQSESAIDVRITADIRRAIVEDDTMSTNAENIKIMTDKSGVVTLRGIVNSQAEKDAIDAKARAVGGVTRVDNQLEIQPN